MQINQAAIYSCDDVQHSDEYPKSFAKKLKVAGFLQSQNKEVYYHPNHWASMQDESFDPSKEGYNLGCDCFTCKTPEAIAWCNEEG